MPFRKIREKLDGGIALGLTLSWLAVLSAIFFIKKNVAEVDFYVSSLYIPSCPSPAEHYPCFVLTECTIHGLSSISNPQRAKQDLLHGSRKWRFCTWMISASFMPE